MSVWLGPSLTGLGLQPQRTLGATTDSGYHSHNSGWGQGCIWGRGAAGARALSHLNVPAAHLSHLSQQAFQLLPQLPLVAWGTPSLIENGENLEAKEEKELQVDP